MSIEDIYMKVKFFCPEQDVILTDIYKNIVVEVENPDAVLDAVLDVEFVQSAGLGSNHVLYYHEAVTNKELALYNGRSGKLVIINPDMRSWERKSSQNGRQKLGKTRRE